MLSIRERFGGNGATRRLGCRYVWIELRRMGGAGIGTPLVARVLVSISGRRLSRVALLRGRLLGLRVR